MGVAQSAQDASEEKINTVNVVEVKQRNLGVVVRKGLRDFRRRQGRVRRYRTAIYTPSEVAAYQVCQ